MLLCGYISVFKKLDIFKANLFFHVVIISIFFASLFHHYGIVHGLILIRFFSKKRLNFVYINFYYYHIIASVQIKDSKHNFKEHGT